MFVDLETERLRLKCIDRSDRDFIFREFRDDFVNTYLYDQEPMVDIGEADGLIDFYTQAEPRDRHRWVILDKAGLARMGTLGYHLWNRDSREAEIGFELLEEYNGKGYMSEAVAAVLAFGEEVMGLRRIKAVVSINNENCQRLLDRFDFAKVGEEETLFRGRSYSHDVRIRQCGTGVGNSAPESRPARA